MMRGSWGAGLWSWFAARACFPIGLGASATSALRTESVHQRSADALMNKQKTRRSTPIALRADKHTVRTHSKVLSVEEAARTVRTAQSSGEVVVLCHGCFDIVHPGHIRHLQHAAKLGDRLLVTITGDALMEKGTGRPLIPQELRAENLAALDCVRWVAINPRPTAAELLEIIQPDVYVKGREYEHNHDPRFTLERQIVERHGGRVVFTSGCGVL